MMAAKQKDEETKGIDNSMGLSRQMEKIKIQQFLLAKKREDTWQRAIGTLGLKPTLLKEMKRTEI